jgi:hypothetical protein
MVFSLGSRRKKCGCQSKLEVTTAWTETGALPTRSTHGRARIYIRSENRCRFEKSRADQVDQLAFLGKNTSKRAKNVQLAKTIDRSNSRDETRHNFDISQRRHPSPPRPDPTTRHVPPPLTLYKIRCPPGLPTLLPHVVSDVVSFVVSACRGV